MQRFSDMSPSKYFKADDFEEGPRTFTIDGVEKEDMNDGREKWVLYFRGETRGLVLNSTNLHVLEELFLDSVDQSLGQKIELFLSETTNPVGKRVMGIRLREPRRRRKPDHEPMRRREAPLPGPDEGEDLM